MNFLAKPVGKQYIAITVNSVELAVSNSCLSRSGFVYGTSASDFLPDTLKILKMHILHVHNNHLTEGGTEIMFKRTVSMLEAFGQKITVYERSNREIDSFGKKVSVALNSFYSRHAPQKFKELLDIIRPDVVHVHNLYPLISTALLDVCQKSRVPVVMRLPDFTLLCPTSHHFRKNSICELCLKGKEYNCVLTNCRGNLLMSTIYAARTALARQQRLFLDKVRFFIAPTNFVRERFLQAGFAGEQIKVIPNIVEIPEKEVTPAEGEYIAYAGRISPEKGIQVLLEAGQRSGLPVRIAGDLSDAPPGITAVPSNIKFVDKLDRQQLGDFFRKARFCVVPSVCFEAFSLVCAEAMSYGLPVVASRIGGLPEVVDDQKTGVLFESGNTGELTAIFVRLWAEKNKIRRMGEAARRKVIAQYSPEIHYEKLMKVYENAVASRL